MLGGMCTPSLAIVWNTPTCCSALLVSPWPNSIVNLVVTLQSAGWWIRPGDSPGSPRPEDSPIPNRVMYS